MQAYDVTRKRVVNVERERNGTIIAYSLLENSKEWFFPLIKDGKNVESYEILEQKQESFIGG